MIDEHAAAIKALLETTGRPIYDTKAPADAGSRYVVFYLSTAAGHSRRVSADAPSTRFLLSTKYVGSSPKEVRALIDRVWTVLGMTRLVVPGRNCSPFVRPRSADQVRSDDTIEPPAFVATDPWPFVSAPAA